MRIRVLAIALALLAVVSPVSAEDTWSGVERIVAVGDVHGDFAQFVAVLRSAEIIDRDNKWSGGKTHLVQCGDVLDRGADSRKVMDLLMSLEKQAQEAGGAVHALIGNHEAMNVYGDLRYVSAGEYASYQTDKSASVRDMYYDQHVKELRSNPPPGGAPVIDAAYKAKWETTHPLGYFEHRTAFAPDGVYGKWIRGHEAIVKINDMVFLHGGIGPKYAKAGIRKINEQVQKELKDFSRLEGGTAMDPEGPLWFRGLALDDERKLESHLKGTLERLGAKYMVIAHTVTKGMITPRFDGRVIMIDVGLSQVYGARTACLLVEGGKQFAMHRGNKVAMPTNMGSDLTRYMDQIRALDLQPRP